MRHPAVIALVIVGSLLVAVSAAALWATVDLLNADRFATKVTAAFEEEEVRVAIAEGVVDRLLEDRPLAARLLRERIVEFVAPLMAHPMFGDVIARTVTSAHDLLLTETKRPLYLDFAALSPVLTGIVSIVDPALGEQIEERLAEMDSKVTLFAENELPRIRRWAAVPAWLWPIAGLLAVVCFGIAIAKALDRQRAVAWTGYSLAAAGGLMLLFLPAIQTTVVSRIAGPGARALVDAALGNLLADLEILAICVVAAGGVVWLAGRAVLMDAHSPAAD